MTDRRIAQIGLVIAVLAMVGLVWHAVTPTPPAHTPRGET